MENSEVQKVSCEFRSFLDRVCDLLTGFQLGLSFLLGERSRKHRGGIAVKQFLKNTFAVY